jgi:UDP-N-acetylmuramyl pentapeptide synthase
MVYPVLAAIAVALEAGIPLERALTALESLEPTAGRLQPVILPSGAVLLRDDYKSALESMVAALDILSQVPARRRYVVLGEVNEPQGPLGPVYRDLGERIGRSATKAYLFCSGRRFRDYGSGAARAGLPRSAVVRVEGGSWSSSSSCVESWGRGTSR